MNAHAHFLLRTYRYELPVNTFDFDNFQATLVRHQRYECGISASYPCSLCGRKFKRRDVLKGHVEKCVNKSQVQETQRKFKCGV